MASSNPLDSSELNLAFRGFRTSSRNGRPLPSIRTLTSSRLEEANFAPKIEMSQPQKMVRDLSSYTTINFDQLFRGLFNWGFHDQLAIHNPWRPRHLPTATFAGRDQLILWKNILFIIATFAGRDICRSEQFFFMIRTFADCSNCRSWHLPVRPTILLKTNIFLPLTGLSIEQVHAGLSGLRKFLA